MNDVHADGATVPGVAANGGINNGETVVVTAGLALGESGLTVTEGAMVVGVDGDTGAIDGLPAVPPVDEVGDIDSSSVVSPIDDSIVETSELTTPDSAGADSVEPLPLVILHTTIAIPKMKTMIETGVIHFRAIVGRYQFPKHP